jgi:uncharacterized membrane protein YraQ (UPF0718 family)
MMPGDLSTSGFFGGLQEFARIGASILLDAGFWIVISLLMAGVIYEYLGRQSRLNGWMRRGGVGSYAGALGAGTLLPICSCGVIPLAIGLRFAGVRLGPVMTFAAATPVINPAAVLLSYALLGPEITLAYLLFGLTAPVIAGLVVERFSPAGETPIATELKSSCCATRSGCGGAPRGWNRLAGALRWGVTELGPTLGLYLTVGIVLAAAVLTLAPAEWIPEHMGAAAPLTSLLWVALLGMIIYVCAVAHIPLVAALILAGASPGIAIVFLVTGAVTNLPELIALQKILGRRAIAVYVATLLVLSVFAGWLVNLWLLPDFQLRLDPMASLDWSDLSSRLTFIVPEYVAVGSAALVGLLCLWGVARWLQRLLVQPQPGCSAA